MPINNVFMWLKICHYKNLKMPSKIKIYSSGQKNTMNPLRNSKEKTKTSTPDFTLVIKWRPNKEPKLFIIQK